METNKSKQQQRLLHVGSIFVAVTLIAIFFILGGGKEDATSVANVQEEGLNSELPDPSSSQLTSNKLDVIVQEEKRIMNEKSNQQKQNNNSFDLMTNLNTPEEEVKKDEFMNKDVETKIDINAEIASPSTDRTVSSATPQRRSYSSSTASAAPQKKVASSSNKTDLSDAAELRRRKKEEEKRQLRIRYGLEAEKEETPATEEKTETLPTIPSSPKKKGFKTMGASANSSDPNTIRAVIHGEQKNITTASQVKLRLLDPISIDGVLVPRNTIVYGKASFSDNRMSVTIDNVRYGTNLLPFVAEIYDMDGFKGLYVPDNITNDAKKDASSGTVSRTNVISGTSTGIINTAISATNNAIKSVTEKKIREVKVDLPANYKLLIKMRKK
jgi:hypothetical protein